MEPEPDSFRPIARLRGPFRSKFGLPRQAGLVPAIRADVVFEPPYRRAEAFRGLEAFSHVWLLWKFSGAERAQWSPTVRPPRLGGNSRLGVFATRSPFRPNPIGLSCVRLESIGFEDPEGPVLHVLGADLMDGTPIYDVKPYLPYADAIPDAVGGFAGAAPPPRLTVADPKRLLARFGDADRTALEEALAADPRPAYQDEPGRVYGLPFGDSDVRFTVEGNVLRITEVVPGGCRA